MNKIIQDEELVDPFRSFISKSRYARWIEEYGRRETWAETANRYVDFFSAKVDLTPDEKSHLRYNILNHKVMPSMRAIMTSGEALERSNVAGYNCSFISVNDPRAFDEALYILMCGTGLGFGVERKEVARMPVVPALITTSEEVIVIHDSKEGWAQGFRELISSLYRGELPKWDLRQLRPEGARLKTFGGRSSGPKPLNDLFEFTVGMFLNARGRKLKPIEAHELMCMVGSIVVVGGVRRSALISLSSLNDDDIRDAKSGEWWVDKSHLALSNNSAVYHDKPTQQQFSKEWAALVASGSGERGIFNLGGAKRHVPERRDADQIKGTNPCFTADTMLMTESGWVSFGDAYKSGDEQTIIQDGRITYSPSPDGKEHPENWNISTAGQRGIMTKASEVFLTQRDVPVLRMETQNGQTIRLTPDHLVATPTGMVPAGDLNVGDVLMVTAAPLPTDVLGNPETVDEIEGFLMGMLAGDGTYSRGKLTEQAHIDMWGKDRKQLTAITQMIDVLWENYSDSILPGGNKPFTKYTVVVDSAHNKVRINSSFLAALLKSKYGFSRETKHTVPAQLISNARTRQSRFYVSALAFCDGTVNKYNKVGSSSIRISQSNFQMLSDINKILLANGIVAPLCKRSPAGTAMMPDGHGGLAEYKTKAKYEIVIMQHTFEFTRFIGFYAGDKKSLSESMFSKVSHKVNTNTKVVSIDSDGREDVYCLKEDVRRTLTAGGVAMRRCAEILLRDKGLCNLSEIIVEAEDTLEELKAKVALATKIGTWQSTMTNFPYLRDEWKKNAEEERLLGVSMTGQMGHNTLNGRNGRDEKNRWLKELKKVAITTNKKEARRLGINPSAAITTVKPSGTVSTLTNTSSGMHAWHDEFFIRRVRVSKTDPIARFMSDAGVPVEDDVMNSRSVVFAFPFKAPDGAVTRNDMNAIEQLEMWLDYKTYWTEHSPSVTVSVKNEEWEEVGKWVFEHFDEITGVSFLPFADHIYQQAPFETIGSDLYNEMLAETPDSLDWSRLPIYELEDSTTGSQTLACTAGQCDVSDLLTDKEETTI